MIEFLWTALRWLFWIVVAPALALVVLGALAPDKMTRRSRMRHKKRSGKGASRSSKKNPPVVRSVERGSSLRKRALSGNSTGGTLLAARPRRSDVSSTSSQGSRKGSSARKVAMSVPSISSFDDLFDEGGYTPVNSRSISTPTSQSPLVTPNATLRKRGVSASLSTISGGSVAGRLGAHERAASIRFDNMGVDADDRDDIFAAAEDAQRSAAKKKWGKSPFWGKIYANLGTKSLKTPRDPLAKGNGKESNKAQEAALGDVARVALKVKKLSSPKKSSGGAIAAARSAWKTGTRIQPLDTLDQSKDADGRMLEKTDGASARKDETAPAPAAKESLGRHACAWFVVLIVVSNVVVVCALLQGLCASSDRSLQSLAVTQTLCPTFEAAKTSMDSIAGAGARAAAEMKSLAYSIPLDSYAASASSAFGGARDSAMRALSSMRANARMQGPSSYKSWTRSSGNSGALSNIDMPWEAWALIVLVCMVAGRAVISRQPKAAANSTRRPHPPRDAVASSIKSCAGDHAPIGVMQAFSVVADHVASDEVSMELFLALLRRQRRAGLLADIQSAN